MARTTIAPLSPMAQKKWGASLAVDTQKKSYWDKKFVGTGENNIIEEKKDLETDAGDRMSFDLSVALRQAPTRGDNTLEGKSESLKFHSDEVIIDQVRNAVSTGGKMSRKRITHDTRKVGKERASDYWSQWKDQLIFMYLSGARGTNEDFIEPESFSEFAGNPLQAPDADHIMFGGSAVSKATITAADKMTAAFIRKANTRAKMMRSRNPDLASLVPVTVNGEERYVVVMNPYQAHDMKEDTGTSGWLEIQKAAAGAEGAKSKLFSGNIGMIDGTILHEHGNTVRFNDGGAGGDVEMARALYMGRQAGVVAYGMPNGASMFWKEKMADFDNQLDIAGGTIIGVKKARFNNHDFGVIALDTAAKDPSAA